MGGCCNFVLDRLRRGVVVLLRCGGGSKIYYCGVCKYLLSWLCL